MKNGTHLAFLSCADLHLTAKRPACRKDDYVATELRKLERLLEAGQETTLKLVLCAGDVFDHATKNIDFDFLSDVIYVFKKYPDVLFLTVPGNHDQRFWNKVENSRNNALFLLESACDNVVAVEASAHIDILTERWRRLGIKGEGLNVIVHASGWGTKLEDVYEQAPIKEKQNLCFYVGLTHRPVFQEEVPFWAGSNAVVDSVLCSYIRRASPVTPDVVITGDNHESFALNLSGLGMKLINPGPMLRSNIDFIDKETYYIDHYIDIKDDVIVGNHFEPHVFIHYGEKNVFDMDYVNEKKNNKTTCFNDLQELLDEVDNMELEQLQFREVLRTLVKQKAEYLEKKLEYLLEEGR